MITPDSTSAVCTELGILVAASFAVNGLTLAWTWSRSRAAKLRLERHERAHGKLAEAGKVWPQEDN